MSVGVQTVKWYQEAEKISKPYITRCLTNPKQTVFNLTCFQRDIRGQIGLERRRETASCWGEIC